MQDYPFPFTIDAVGYQYGFLLTAVAPDPQVDAIQEEVDYLFPGEITMAPVVKCLLQFHIAMEETKFGFNMEDVVQMVESEEYKAFINVRICGVMGMATFTEDMGIVRKEFIYLRNCFNTLKEKYFSGNEHFTEISMGMSGDFRVAVEEGSTIVRVGSLIFGERN